MIINYDFQCGPHDWERYEYEVDYSEMEDFVNKYYSDAEVADMYISEIYNADEKCREDFKKELDINNADELREYMLTYGGVDWAIEELIDGEGIEIFDRADKAHKADLYAYFEDAAYEQYQDEIDMAASNEWIAMRSRYW